MPRDKNASLSKFGTTSNHTHQSRLTSVTYPPDVKLRLERERYRTWFPAVPAIYFSVGSSIDQPSCIHGQRTTKAEDSGTEAPRKAPGQARVWLT